MTFFGRLTFYRIVRDHNNETKFFRIDVPEASQHGVGVQLNVCGVLYGASIHTKTAPWESEADRAGSS